MQPTRADIESWLARLLANDAYAGHPLLAEVQWLAQHYLKLAHRQDKITRISDAMQAQLKELNLELQAADRAKTEFLAVMSHEIRTPLSAVLGTLQLLERTALDAEQRDHVATLGESSRALHALLNDILDLTRLEIGTPEPERIDFEPSRVLDGVLAMNAARAREKGLRFKVDCRTGVPPVLKGDPGRLRQMLMNLVGNAVKFTERGAVTVRVERVDDGGDPPRLKFSVIDTGVGTDVAPEILLQPFTQADAFINRRYGGAGLGLAICKRLTEAMGGSIGIESRRGQGTTAWFVLPFEAGEHCAPPAPPARLPPLTILLVEDEPVNRRVTAALLQQEGHEVAVAADGPEALAQLAERYFDVVLMDVHMPGMSGLQLARHIRTLPDAVPRNVAILALSADVTAATRAAALDAGVDGFAAKPVDMTRLTALLHEILFDPAQAAAETSPAGEDASTVLDETFLDMLHAQLGAPDMDELLTLFRNRGADAIAAARQALQEHNLAQAAQHAHRLAGMAGNMGVAMLAQAAQDLEEAARGNDAEQAARHAARLDPLYQRSLQCIEEWQARMRHNAE